jgi:hypothetical protein
MVESGIVKVVAVFTVLAPNALMSPLTSDPAKKALPAAAGVVGAMGGTSAFAGGAMASIVSLSVWYSASSVLMAAFSACHACRF